MYASLVLISSMMFGSGLQKTPKSEYPDLSEPKAAAFSFCVAYVIGVVNVAKEIYAGKDAGVLDQLDAIGSLSAKRQRLANAATKRFGKNAESLILLATDTEPKFSLRAGENKAPLSAYAAAAKVE